MSLPRNASPASLPFALLANVPPPGPRNVTLRVDASGERALRSGHPWLFEDGVRAQSHTGRPGDFAVVWDARRRFLAIGLYDPDSPIRVRVLHAGEPIPIDVTFFAERLRRCASRRQRILASGTTGVRLVHGENDGMPGLVVDRYGPALVVKLYTAAWVPHLATVVSALLAVQPADAVILRLGREAGQRAAAAFGLSDGALLWGREPDAPLVFEENGLRFECDPRRGHKTGFFLDQRDNRARVERLSEGRSVLDVFAYAGGFSLYAARGGARRVVSVDRSGPALDAARRNFAQNVGPLTDARRALAASSRPVHETIVADAWGALAELRAAGRRFDVVVLDPPSFANRQTDVPRALAAYERLLELGLGVLAPDGTLVMASCSARVSADEWFARVHRRARELGQRLDEIERTGHAEDHPIGFAEGAYLKCLFARRAAGAATRDASARGRPRPR